LKKQLQWHAFMETKGESAMAENSIVKKAGIDTPLFL